MLQRLRTTRNRELVNLLLLGVLVTAGFTSVLVARSNTISTASLGYAGPFIALFVVAHLALRAGLPDADPYLLPLTGLLTALGITEIYRIDPVLARDQAVWLTIGVGFFVVLVLRLREYRVLEQYRYVLGAMAIAMLGLTIVAGTKVNGARLWIRVGSHQIQPAEFAKICLVLFLAGYLRERRELLAYAGRRVLGVSLPPWRHFAPLLAMWGMAVGLLVLMNDFGTSLLFFGVFLAMVYVATGRFAYVVIGAGSFALAAVAAYRVASQVGERVSIWIDPWKTPHTSGYQIVQSIYTIADGGVFGTGLGRGLLLTGSHHRPIIPAVQTDFIYSAIASELGLAGASGLLLCYLLIAYRGFKVATLAGDGFSKLVAVGLTTVLALQAVLIVGGVVRLIPLTGITLPFVSYGGSSIVSNWILLALLLAVSDRANRLAEGRG